ncbi:MAG: hypothetical protein GX639_19545 [Fibrobacter sp.]|nr:hypothetical protein [Fibrobacter sp.]
MGKDLVIISIDNDHARKVIARLLCQKQSIPLQKALAITAKPPFIFIINESHDALKKVVDQYSQLGIVFKIIDSLQRKPAAPPHDSAIPDKVPPGTYNDSSQKTEPSQKTHTVHHLPLDDIPVVTEISKKKVSVKSLLLFLLIILLPVVLVIFAYREKRTAFLEDYDGKVSGTKVSKTKKTVSTGQSKSSSAISPENRAKSADFVDSASAYNEDYEMAISFFKLAISFNKYNYRAWYGLVNTYHSMNELDKEKKAKDEMEMLFGKNVFDIGSIVKPFGELLTAELRSDSSYFLEYTTQSSSRQTLVNETFQIVRALKPVCNCVSIAIFAQKSAGRGLIVHIKSDRTFFNLADYTAVASFTYLE